MTRPTPRKLWLAGQDARDCVRMLACAERAAGAGDRAHAFRLLDRAAEARRRFAAQRREVRT